MRKREEDLISELMSSLNAEEGEMSRRIIECLSALGYTPQKQQVRDFVLAFKSKSVKQTIAKLGVRSGKNPGAFFGVKFYACKKPPVKFMEAVRDAVVKTNGQYPCSDCGVCGAAEGERGYRVTLPDGTEFLRCGAYVVEIPGLTAEDVDDFIGLLQKQHAYFLARPGRPD